MRLISYLTQRARLRAEDGFVMIVAIGALGLVLALSVVAFAAVSDDQRLSANDNLQKQAFAAAQVGIQRYLFNLDQDNNFWEQCVPSPDPSGINLNGSIANRRPVPGSATESYAIELMPAAGQTTYTSCSKTDPVTSMIQASAGAGAGAIRIRSTGFAGSVKRTLVAVVRKKTFLDYVWFTKFETDDPIVQAVKAGYSPGVSPWDTVLAGAQKQCAMYWRTDATSTGRFNAPFYGNNKCDQISFINGDNIQGPMHTNDEFAICGAPTFGRNSNDAIEIGAPPTGETNQGQGGCTAGAKNLGQVQNNAELLDPPPSNASLKSIATLTFTGNTCINLDDGSGSSTSPHMSVAQPAVGQSCKTAGLTWSSYPYPSNGVLYIKNSSTLPCSPSFNFLNPVYVVTSTGQGANTGCGNAYVHGTYHAPLTIGAENDLVIDGNIAHSGADSVLGLVANGFVRVYHPVTGATDDNGCTATNNSDVLQNPSVDAAIMSVQHSFIADNYTCGATMGKLSVFGSIAQLSRGGVGQTSGGTAIHGYVKNYVYDDRLRYEEPPHFLDPVLASWRVVREDECAPGVDPTDPTNPLKDNGKSC